MAASKAAALPLGDSPMWRRSYQICHKRSNVSFSVRFRTLARGGAVLYTLSAQMFAIVDIAGFQEKVQEGDALKVPLHDVKSGEKIIFEKVLLLSNGDALTIGLPFVKGATVEAKVVSHGQGKKIRVQKANKRKRYRRVHGHRQDFTEIEITKIKA